MGKLKVTLVRKVSQLPKLKSTGYEKKGEKKWQK